MILNGRTEYTDKWMNPQCFCYNCFVTQNLVQEIFNGNDLVQFCYLPLPFFSAEVFISNLKDWVFHSTGQGNEQHEVIDFELLCIAWKEDDSL